MFCLFTLPYSIRRKTSISGETLFYLHLVHNIYIHVLIGMVNPQPKQQAISDNRSDVDERVKNKTKKIVLIVCMRTMNNVGNLNMYENEIRYDFF